MTLGERLVLLRNRAGLSQDALAERLGVSRQSISKWENDSSVPDLDKLVKLSEVFDVTLDELVKGETPPSAAPQAAGASALWQRLTALYREKFYLLGWGLAAWGIWGLLKSVWTTLTLFLPSSGLWEALNFFFITLLPAHLMHLLKMLLGALFVLYGKRLAGRFRWYHLSWPMIAIGLFGIPIVRKLRTGLLHIFTMLYYVMLNPQSTEELQEFRLFAFSDLNGCLFLFVLGILLLVYGKRKYAKEKSAE